MKVAACPTFGRSLSTVLVSCRSAFSGVTVTLAVLLAGLGSGWAASLMVAVLTTGVQPATCPTIVRVAVELAATVPTDQIPDWKS